MDKIELLKSKFGKIKSEIHDLNILNDIKVKFMGKNGELSSLMKNMKDLSPEERPAFGKKVNEIRDYIETKLIKIETELAEKEKNERLKKEKIDVTIPVKIDKGSLHPITLVKNEISDIFIGLGFEVVEGPEVETDHYNFQMMTIPKDHPARDMQDTFYFSDNLLLRTHTSPVQARTMEIKKPPIRMICPGKVYRADDDATHSPIFNQIEGLVVDRKITLCDLKGLLDEFVKLFFNKNTKTRFRPSYFPFTEPSVEVDASCSECGGKGCKVCKGTGWIEILGAGMVNPKVLQNAGIDPEKYTGFAFGLGVDRMAMIKYKINDLRLMYENDIRFLKQF